MGINSHSTNNNTLKMTLAYMKQIEKTKKHQCRESWRRGMNLGSQIVILVDEFEIRMRHHKAKGSRK